MKWNVERIVLRVIGCLHDRTRVVIAADDVVAVLLEHLVGIGARDAGLHVDKVHVDIGIVERERPRPKELPRRLFEREHPAAFRGGQHDIVLAARFDRRIDPAHMFGIRG